MTLALRTRNYRQPLLRNGGRHWRCLWSKVSTGLISIDLPCESPDSWPVSVRAMVPDPEFAWHSRLKCNNLPHISCAGGLAFLLHTGIVPGWRRYTRLQDLSGRIVRPSGPRLPVVLTRARPKGELVVLQAVHFPWMHRWLARYRGCGTDVGLMCMRALR